VQFSELQKLSDLDLDLRSGRSHIGAYITSRSTHTPNCIEIEKLFLWTDGLTDGRTNLNSNLLGHHLAIWVRMAEPVRYASIECRLVFFVCQTELSKK